MRGPMHYRRDIDGLRALAVVPIVLFHAGMPGFSGGFIGVDVFFVISGFLITSIIARDMREGRFSLLAFYERRARRILPALVTMLAIVLGVGCLLMIPSELLRLGRSAAATVLFASNIRFARSFDYFATAAEYDPLLHTWSLAVEEQFYLAYPLMLMAVARLGQSRRMLAAVAAVSVLSFAAGVAALEWRPVWAFYITIFRAWELGAGAVLALAMRPPPASRAAREALGLAGLLAILVPVFVYSNATDFPGLAAFPPVLGATVLIWIGQREAGSLASRLLALGPMVAAGLISYSLYLWHWPILAYLRILEGSVILPPVVATGAVAAAVVMAMLSFRFIEQPFRRHPPAGFGRRAIFAMGAASIAVLCVAGETLHRTMGWPQRLSPQAMLIQAAAKDHNPRRKDCFEGALQKEPCHLGAPEHADGQIDFVMLGDSHSEMLIPGIDRAAAAAGQYGRFAGRAACLPIPMLERVRRGAECVRHNRAVWAWLAQRPDIDTVIIAARWILWVEGTRADGEAGDDSQLRPVGSADTRDRGDNAALVERALAATVDRLLANGRRVVIVGPVPEAVNDVPIDTTRRLLMGLPQPPQLTRAQFEARASRTEALLARIAARSPMVSYLPLADLFCDAAVCRAFGADGIPLYIDDDHLTRTTVQTLLRPRLDTIWQAPARQ